ncbi:MAG: DIP1984 family protein [Oscillospiraceae bacterium]|nr:DIP1984 family protein [Oscillospiraceae bacterium]
MKLAEALQERSDINKKINQLRNRLSNNLLVQEGEKTAEDPLTLLKELDLSIKRLQYLIEHINLTNCQTLVGDKTITELLARKDALTVQISAYRDVIEQGSRNTDRARHSEIKILSTINVAEIQKKTDRLAKDLRNVDNLLQETNWKTELL